MIKKYVKWKRVKVNESFYKDINTNNAFQNETKDSDFKETPYELNWYFLGIAVYPEDTPQEFINWLIEKFSEFEVEFISEKEVNEFLNSYWVDENWEQFVKVNEFSFIDNRPIEEIN